MHTLVILLTVLESLFTTLSERTLKTDFSVTMGAEQSQPMTYNGDITMRGETFRANLLGIEAAYDGKTFYAYQEDIDELTLSYPTRQELLEANPFLFASAMRDACNITEHDSKDGKICLITMTPKDAATGIHRITLRVNKSTLLPLSIEIKEGAKTTTLRTKNPTWTDATESWKITKENAYINDLRL